MVTARRAESTTRVVWEMVVPTVRTLACVPVLLSVLATIAAVIYSELITVGVPMLGETLRTSAVVMAIGAGFTLDDSASETTAAVPFSLLRRRLVRAGMSMLILAPAWGGLLLYAYERGAQVPAVVLTLELGTLVAVALAVATVFTRMGRASPGAFVAPTMLVFRQATALIPARWGLWAGEPGSVLWAESHRRWGALAVAAILTAAWLSHDPARKPLTHRAAAPPQRGARPADRAPRF